VPLGRSRGDISIHYVNGVLPCRTVLSLVETRYDRLAFHLVAEPGNSARVPAHSVNAATLAQEQQITIFQMLSMGFWRRGVSR
jgi:hypothetical protein